MLGLSSFLDQVLVVCLASLLYLPSSRALANDQPPATPLFVAQFSSAKDVRHPHPVLDKALDIALGPKDEQDRSLTELEAPYAVTGGFGKRVVVTDVTTRKVHVFDFAAAKHSLLQHPQLLRPASLATDRNGNVYVTDSRSANIFVFDHKGKFRGFLREEKRTESFFQAPDGIAIDAASGRAYVVDSPRHMVVVLDNKGRVLGQIGRRGGGKGTGEFRYPTQIAIADGEIFVLDSGNVRVQVLDLAGHFRRQIILPSGRHSGLAIDNKKRVYISNDELDSVAVYSPSGQSLYTFGHIGADPGDFRQPAGMWMEAGHCLYVADTRNKRVQVFEVEPGGPQRCILY